MLISERTAIEMHRKYQGLAFEGTWGLVGEPLGEESKKGKKSSAKVASHSVKKRTKGNSAYDSFFTNRNYCYGCHYRFSLLSSEKFTPAPHVNITVSGIP